MVGVGVAYGGGYAECGRGGGGTATTTNIKLKCHTYESLVNIVGAFLASCFELNTDMLPSGSKGEEGGRDKYIL